MSNFFAPASADGDYFDERLRTNQDTADHDHDDFVSFAEALMTADDDALPEALGRFMDIDYLLRYMAVDFAIGNWDGITTFYCGDEWGCGNHNFYIYKEEERPFFWLIPWDLEASFMPESWIEGFVPWDNLDASCEEADDAGSEDHPVRPAGCDQMIRAIALADRERYEGYLEEVLEEHFTPEIIEGRMTALVELISPYIKADPDQYYEEWLLTVLWQMDMFEDLRERLRQEIGR